MCTLVSEGKIQSESGRVLGWTEDERRGVRGSRTELLSRRAETPQASVCAGGTGVLITQEQWTRGDRSQVCLSETLLNDVEECSLTRSLPGCDHSLNMLFLTKIATCNHTSHVWFRRFCGSWNGEGG